MGVICPGAASLGAAALLVAVVELVGVDVAAVGVVEGLMSFTGSLLTMC